MAFTSEDIKIVRKETGVGVLEARKALEEAGGRTSAAIKLLSGDCKLTDTIPTVENTSDLRKETPKVGLFGKAPKPEIKRVKCLGVRTAEETKVMATYNSTMYCFLVEYMNGAREIVECDASSKQLTDLIMYIEM